LGEGSHGSILNGNYTPNRVTSAWKSTLFGLWIGHATLRALFADFGSHRKSECGKGNAGCVDHFGSYVANSPVGDNFPRNSLVAADNINARLIQIEPDK
jgi:hypothetical protein